MTNEIDCEDSARDKLLFTPGPLTTSLTVKQAMLHDLGSWRFEFLAAVARDPRAPARGPPAYRGGGAGRRCPSRAAGRTGWKP